MMSQFSVNFIIIFSFIFLAVLILISMIFVGLNKYLLNNDYPELSKKYKFSFLNILMVFQEIKVIKDNGEVFYLKNDDKIIQTNRIVMTAVFLYMTGSLLFIFIKMN